MENCVLPMTVVVHGCVYVHSECVDKLTLHTATQSISAFIHILIIQFKG